jgi:PAS domain S-box-containing protein
VALCLPDAHGDPMTPLALVIEDDPVTRKLVRSTLEAAGYEVVFAADGESGLRKASERPPDLVLAGMALPDVRGTLLLPRLRAALGAGVVPVVALASAASLVEEAQARSAGFDDYLLKPLDPARLLDAVAAHRPGGVRPNGGAPTRHVLLVDHDPVLAHTAALWLAERGFRVSTVRTADEALAWARSEPPDAVLADVLMPGMDGLRLCHAFRQDPRAARVPIVLMAGHAPDEQDRALARRMGAQALVARTPRFELAAQALHEALAGAPPGGAEAWNPELEQAYRPHVTRHLERRDALERGLLDRAKERATGLAVLRGVAESFSPGGGSGSATAVALGHCLEAAGLTQGALVTPLSGGGARVIAQVGFRAQARPDVERYFAGEGRLERLLAAGVPAALPDTTEPPEPQAGLLRLLGAASALLVPSGAAGPPALLVLASATRDLAHEDWRDYGRVLASQFQCALALAHTFEAVRGSEDAARQALVRTESILETAVDGIVVINERGLIETFNAAAERMFGLRRSDAVGKDVTILMPAEFHARHKQGLAHYLRTGEARILGRLVEMTGRRADGSKFPMELTVTESRVDGTRRFLGTLRDLTEKRKLEEQLRQAQKMEAVGRLAGGVAHDFNNLLSVISGYTQLLLGAVPPDSPLRRQLEQVDRAAERASALTRQLLSFSRKQVVQPRILDLNEVVREAAEMLGRLIGEDVALVVRPAPMRCPVLADQDQLQQVLMNLAVNARDAMPHGGNLIVETGRTEVDERTPTNPVLKPGPYAVLAVSDTGIGMDEAVRMRLFEPFFTTKEEGKGTGLGLSTLYAIVRQCEGAVHVYSEPGRGTTFRIYLPWVRDEQPQPPAPATEVRPARGHEVILVVEDDKDVRRIALEVLTGAGYRVLEAATPEEALAAVASATRPIDLVLTDVVMPGMNGKALAERLRALGGTPRVVFMSGYTQEAIGHHGVLDLDTHFLAKPFGVTALVKKVREVLDLAVVPTPSS